MTVAFDWSVGPTNNGYAPVTLDACNSFNVGTYHFMISDSTAPSTVYARSTGVGCQATLNVPSGGNPDLITVTGTDPTGSASATTSVVSQIVDYPPPPPSLNCSIVSISADACWRQDIGWTADAFQNKRPPDYVSMQETIGLGPAGLTAEVITITCDGNAFFSGAATSAGAAVSLGPVQVTLAWGYVGDPQLPAESAADIDGFVRGVTDALSIGAIGGANFTHAPGVDGYQQGVEYWVGNTIGISESGQSLAAWGMSNNTTPQPGAYCNGGGTSSELFQQLMNQPVSPANVTVPTVTALPPTSGSATPVTVNGGGQSQIYVAGSGFAPGSDVSIVIHSTPVDMGLFTTDDTGRLGRFVTLPAGLPPGLHTVVVSGHTASGAPLVLQGQFNLTAGAVTAAPTTPSPAKGPPHNNTRVVR